MTKRVWSIAALLVLFPASPGTAQQIEFTPLAGIFVPTADLGEFSVSDTAFGTGTVTLKQKTAGVLGARLGAWWSKNLAWEAGYFSYAFSDLETTAAGISGVGDACADVPDFSCSARVWYLSSKLLYRFLPAGDSPWGILVGGGAAVIGHQGDFWGGGDAITDLGGVIDIGVTYNLSRRFAIRADAEDFLYSFKGRVTIGEDDQIEADSRFQNDLLFTAGLVIRIGRE